MKAIEFLGRSLKTIKSFPVDLRREAGHQLDRVQRGLDPFDWKSMPAIGKGVREIRLHENGQFRILYLLSRGNTVFVLHAFQKNTQKTRRQDICLARIALKGLLQWKAP